MWDYLYFILIALLLGFKHSYDADHLIAVSNILRNIPSIRASFKASIIWALGHMATASAITIFLFIFKESVLKSYLSYFEIFVGIMIILLGMISLISLFEFGKIHKGQLAKHTHNTSAGYSGGHQHKKMLGIGIIHGLASNDELLLLFTTSLGVVSLGTLLVGVGTFSLGVVLGMVVFSMLFCYPLLWKYDDKIYKTITLLTGIISIIYGNYILIGLL